MPGTTHRGRHKSRNYLLWFPACLPLSCMGELRCSGMCRALTEGKAAQSHSLRGERWQIHDRLSCSVWTDARALRLRLSLDVLTRDSTWFHSCLTSKATTTLHEFRFVLFSRQGNRFSSAETSFIVCHVCFDICSNHTQKTIPPFFCSGSFENLITSQPLPHFRSHPPRCMFSSNITRI